MQISRADVADLIYFMAIARHRSFSRAAIELGVSASALSHALKGLETRLGVRLLNRTTKSVTPTAAGEELVQSVLQPFDKIEGALESLNRYRNTPTGRIRINAAVEAANLLLAPVMPAFMDRYPDIEIDIVASNRMVDVTDAGFDAGIRYGGTVPEDMVARRLSADIRWVIAASPDYLERYGTPEHPDDLLHHRCISNRLGDDRIYRWELERDGETYQITVPYAPHLNAEALHAWGLYKSGFIRDIYFRQDRPGVAIFLECDSVDEAMKVMAEFPLAKAGLLSFECIPLGSFINWENLFAAEFKNKE